MLILFVIMLIGSERIETQADYRNWTPYVGMALGVLLLGSLAYSLTSGFVGLAPQPGAVAGGATAQVVGSQIRASAWELLIAMLLLEAAFGVSGVIAAPIYYAYVKDELSARGLI